MLSSAGYDVAAVISGRRALKRLQTYIPDLIFLDVKMPGIDGFEICRQIKSNERTADIPIIFITAFSEPESIEKGFSMGAADYINNTMTIGGSFGIKIYDGQADQTVREVLSDADKAKARRNCVVLPGEAVFHRVD